MVEPFKNKPFENVAWYYNKRKDARYFDPRAFYELREHELLLPGAHLDRHFESGIVRLAWKHDDILSVLGSDDEHLAQEVLNGEWWLRWAGINPAPLYERGLVR